MSDMKIKVNEAERASTRRVLSRSTPLAAPSESLKIFLTVCLVEHCLAVTGPIGDFGAWGFPLTLLRWLGALLWQASASSHQYFTSVNRQILFFDTSESVLGKPQTLPVLDICCGSI